MPGFADELDLPSRKTGVDGLLLGVNGIKTGHTIYIG